MLSVLLAVKRFARFVDNAPAGLMVITDRQSVRCFWREKLIGRKSSSNRWSVSSWRQLYTVVLDGDCTARPASPTSMSMLKRTRCVKSILRIQPGVPKSVEHRRAAYTFELPVHDELCCLATVRCSFIGRCYG